MLPLGLFKIRSFTGVQLAAFAISGSQLALFLYMVEHAAREGFLSGFNEILLLGGGLSFVGALFALWLVRQEDIRRPDAETEAVLAPSTAT